MHKKDSRFSYVMAFLGLEFLIFFKEWEVAPPSVVTDSGFWLYMRSLFNCLLPARLAGLGVGRGLKGLVALILFLNGESGGQVKLDTKLQSSLPNNLRCYYLRNKNQRPLLRKQPLWWRKTGFMHRLFWNNGPDTWQSTRKW